MSTPRDPPRDHDRRKPKRPPAQRRDPDPARPPTRGIEGPQSGLADPLRHEDAADAPHGRHDPVGHADGEVALGRHEDFAPDHGYDDRQRDGGRDAPAARPADEQERTEALDVAEER